MYWGGMSWVSCSRDTDWLHLLATPPILHYCTAFPVVHWASAVVMLPHGPVRSECCPSLSLLLMPLLLACVKYRSNGLHAVRQLCLIQSDWPMAWGIRERWETACRWRWQLVLEDIHGMTHGKHSFCRQIQHLTFQVDVFDVIKTCWGIVESKRLFYSPSTSIVNCMCRMSMWSLI